jgi:hypothetical protein
MLQPCRADRRWRRIRECRDLPATASGKFIRRCARRPYFCARAVGNYLRPIARNRLRRPGQKFPRESANVGRRFSILEGVSAEPLKVPRREVPQLRAKGRLRNCGTCGTSLIGSQGSAAVGPGFRGSANFEVPRLYRRLSDFDKFMLVSVGAESLDDLERAVGDPCFEHRLDAFPSRAVA